MKASIRERLETVQLTVDRIVDLLGNQALELYLALVTEGDGTALPEIMEDLARAEEKLQEEEEKGAYGNANRIDKFTAECEKLAAKAERLIRDAEVTCAAMSANLGVVAADLVTRYNFE
jgi:cytochrome c556